MTVLEMRKLLGLTQKDFAEKYGISKRSIESWEGGQRKIPEWARALLERAVLEDAKKRES